MHISAQVGVVDTCVGGGTLGGETLCDGEPGRAGGVAGEPDPNLQNPGALMIGKQQTYLANHGTL